MKKWLVYFRIEAQFKKLQLGKFSTEAATFEQAIENMKKAAWFGTEVLGIRNHNCLGFVNNQFS